MSYRALLNLGTSLSGKQRKAADASQDLPGRPSQFLPPSLPAVPAIADLLPDNHLLASLPCSRYWHYERRQEVMGLPPPGIPHWLRRFDWLVGWAHGWADTAVFPRHVYCHPNAMEGLLTLVRSNYTESRKGSFLAVGGEDTLLSAQSRETVSGLLKYFDKIFYEAFDQEIDGVEVMPIGLTEFYLRGYEDSFVRAISRKKEKISLLLSAFGKFWPALNEELEDRRKAIEFSKTCDYVNAGPFPQDEYFDLLASHCYMICPRGKGVQAPKIVEALLTGCIPIVTNSLMASALVKKGAPILVIDEWQNLTEELLLGELTQLSQRVMAFSEIVSNIEEWWNFSFG